MKTMTRACALLTLTLSSTTALAQDGHIHPQGPAAPISITGDHVHDKGEWMVSFRTMHMHMDGNQKGDSDISASDIATTIANPNAPPATMRVVPTKMDMTMHMMGAMYGVTNKLTIMAMASYVIKDMDHLTFAGGAGTTVLGTFRTRTNGIGDTRISGIYELLKNHHHRLNVQMGLSLPTGSIKKDDDVLAPTGARPRLRLPYAMQLGSGTYDALPAITYIGNNGKWGWGAQGSAVIRLKSENAQGYRLGNLFRLTGWGAYDLGKGMSVNTLITAETLGDINGRDDQITAPVTTANPDNYGGERIELGAGFTYEPDYAKNLSFGINARTPIYQDLNGVQLEQDFTLTAGLTFRF